MRAMKSLLPLILLAFAWQPATAREVPANHWVATWSASPQRAGAPIQLQAQTLRQIVHTSLGGSAVRVRISNAYGTTGLVIGAAHVALSAGGASIVSGSDRTLTFGGLPTITIPAGALAVSDVVPLEVPALGDLSVSFYLPDAVAAVTEHTEGLQTTYISGQGNFTGAGTLASQTTTHNFYFLSGVDVQVRGNARAVVAIGDSLTVGFGSTPDLNQRWPDLLAERLQSKPRPRASPSSMPASSAIASCTTWLAPMLSRDSIATSLCRPERLISSSCRAMPTSSSPEPSVSLRKK